MEKGDVSFLRQLVKSLEDAEGKLESAYRNKDVDKFNKIKKIMLNSQRQIERILR